MSSSVVDFSAPDLDFFGREVKEPTVAETVALLRDGDFERVAGQHAAIALLVPLLVAWEWQGTQRQLMDALPSDLRDFDLTDLENVLARLGFQSRRESRRFSAIRVAGTPCLFFPTHGSPVLVIGSNATGLRAFDARGDDAAVAGEQSGTVVCIEPLDIDGIRRAERSGGSWIAARIAQFKPLILELLGLSLLVNLAAVAMPLFVMTVYDRVINSESVLSLKYLVAGVLVLIAGDLAIRVARSNALTYVANRLGYLIGTRVFAQTLDLAHPNLDRVSAKAQFLRLKDGDRIRGFLGSSMTLSCIDLPFVVIYLVIIASLAGPVVIVPVIAIGIFAVAAVVQSRKLREQTRSASFGSMRRQEMVMEAIEKMRAIRVTGGESRWLRRFDEISSSVSRSSLESNTASQFVSNLGQALSTFAALATISLGVGQVIDGDMTAGGLIASMMLIWRVLGPLQGAFVAATRFPQLRVAIDQVDALMRLETERDGNPAVDRFHRVEGRVTFDKVTFRYGRGDPELAQVSFDLEPGEMLAVIGRNGAGKSTLLKLVAGLFHPQAGSVRIDGRDIRQYDPTELRRSMAYVHQRPELFEGTVAECLRLVRPTATDEEILAALDLAGVAHDIDSLPLKLETPLSAHRQGSISDSVLTRLTLARALLAETPIVLLDEPITGVDFEAEFAFIEALQTLRQRATVILVTHRPSHASLSDKVLVLHHGQAKFFGATETVLDKMHSVM